MSERLKTPFKCAIFDDGIEYRSLDSLDASIDRWLDAVRKGDWGPSNDEGNLFDILKNSTLNSVINPKILSITVTDQFIGYDSAVIVLDNKDSVLTNMLFDGAIARTITDTDTLKAFRERVGGDKTVLSEGLQVSIYGGYYSGGDDFSSIKRLFQGMIASISFSYPDSGTPTITL